MPKVTAGAIIYRKTGQKLEILLTKRNVNPFKNYWCLPGGHIEQFEYAESAIIREVKEETNLDFEPRFLFYMDEIFHDEKIHNVVLMYYGMATNNLIFNSSEVSEAGWYLFSEVLKLPLAFNHSQALKQFQKMIKEKRIEY